jgi:hypothetical protein
MEPPQSGGRRQALTRRGVPSSKRETEPEHGQGIRRSHALDDSIGDAGVPSLDEIDWVGAPIQGELGRGEWIKRDPEAVGDVVRATTRDQRKLKGWARGVRGHVDAFVASDEN